MPACSLAPRNFAARVALHSGYVHHARIIVRVFSRCFPHRDSLFPTEAPPGGRATPRSRRPYNIIKAQVKADRPCRKGRAMDGLAGRPIGQKEKETFFLRETRFYFLRYPHGEQHRDVRPRPPRSRCSIWR